MTYYLKNGNTFNVSAEAAIDIRETLPLGTYTVKFDDRMGFFYLVAIEDFNLNHKIYGDTKKRTRRILDTFKDRETSTGVMLSGEKGSGKTLLAKMLSLEAMETGIPTIVINQPWQGDEFNNFMQMIEQPTVVLFDEFEKVYNSKEQEKLLTLLDGVYASKKLFIITCNDKYRVNEHMKNRPGRLYYHFDYRGLDKDFIIEYCNDNLQNKIYIDSIVRISSVFGEFNFDILKAMVEEMNRYDETPQEVMKVLNAKPELSDSAKYDVELFVDETPIPEHAMEEKTWSGNPLSANSFGIYYHPDQVNPGDEDNDDIASWENVKFSASDLQGADPNTGKLTFVNARGQRVVMCKVKDKAHPWDAF